MKITIVTVVYNARETIICALESILNQSYSNIEIIVIDGGSSDGTMEILKKYRKRLSLLISEPDNGIYDAMNKGIKYATGDVIGFLHSDDSFFNKEVLACVAKQFSIPEIHGVYGDLVYISKTEHNKIIRFWKSTKYSEDKLKSGWTPPHPTLYIRSSIYKMVGEFDSSLKISADYDFMLRILKHEKVFCKYIPQTLVKMRYGGVSNNSLKNILLKTKEDYISLKKNKVGGLWTLIFKNIRKIPQFFER